MDRKTSRELIRLAWPIMAGNLLQTLYNLVDTFYLGKVSKEALAAPAIGFVLIMLLVLVGVGFASAGTTLVAQARGAGDWEKVNFYVGQLFFY